MYFYDNLLALLDTSKANFNFRTLKNTYQKDNLIDTKSSLNLINLSSNDYLGLGHDDSLVKDFLKTINVDDDTKGSYYFSSSSSRLLTGHFQIYKEFEDYLAKLYGKEALFINSGYDANTGVISTLFDKDTLILADKKSHASIIDGMLQSKAKSMRFAHNDIDHLKSLIQKYGKDFKTIVVITESIFSMDGDIAPLNDLVLLKKEYDNVLLYVDEAHSFGLYDGGLGLCNQLLIKDDIDFVLFTLGKGFGSSGSVLMCSKVVKEYLVNYMRAFIFTTALPPINLCYSLFLLKRFKDFSKRYQRLSTISQKVIETINECGFKTPSKSQIIPIILGSNEKAIKASEYFIKMGFYALPIRYPTVPKNEARLRLSLSSMLGDDDIKRLCMLIKTLNTVL